jgi:cytochrome c-type biogenesis protein CcmH/NrfG
MLAFLGVVGYFLKIGLGVTGAALGPSANDTDVRTVAGAPNGVGGGTPPQASAAGPPPPVQRLLLEMRERLGRNPRDRGALAALASLYFEAGKFAQAIPYYERALALEPNDPQMRTDYAAALHGAGDDARALAQLETVLGKHPGDPDALFDTGVVANALGRRAQATTAFKTFLRVAPQNARASDARAALRALGS